MCCNRSSAVDYGTSMSATSAAPPLAPAAASLTTVIIPTSPGTTPPTSLLPTERHCRSIASVVSWPVAATASQNMSQKPCSSFPTASGAACRWVLVGAFKLVLLSHVVCSCYFRFVVSFVFIYDYLLWCLEHRSHSTCSNQVFIIISFLRH